MAQGDAQFSSASPFVYHQYVYYANNRLTKSITEQGTTTTTADYYYDHNGNQITKAVSVTVPQSGVAAYFMSPDTNSYLSLYQYDSYNRLKSADTDGTITTYAYDGNNLRQSKASNGITTQHIWDGSNMVMDGANKFYRGATGIEFANLNGATSFYHKDAHGDVTALTNSAGTITQSYIYDAFGNQLNENANDINPFRYCGEYLDSETGLTYLRNRYYDNAIGRFITEDPIKDGLNWYVYCGNNPVMYHDPNGDAAELLATPWGRQQLIWMKGVDALDTLDYDVSAQMLHHSIRWFYANDVYISENVSGVNITGTDRINGELVIQSLEKNSAINNEIDWNINCYEKDGLTHFETPKMVLQLNDTTDLYLSFNNATVKLIGDKQDDGKWTIQVSVHDKYDFDIEKLDNIKSVKTAIGSAAGTVAALEQVPLIGAIKTYDIYVNYSTER